MSSINHTAKTGRSPAAQSPPAEGEFETILKATQTIQAKAAEPESSAFVSANAGTGKTHILVNRVLRLLLGGSAPYRILCLTYTNAAAAEMENRLFGQLASWATQPDAELQTELAELLQRPPSNEEQQRARRLFTSAIETPGGMKVQTIHGFCEKLLQRFPLEASLTPNFRVLEQAEAHELLASAMAHVLRTAMNQPTTREAAALEGVIAHATDMQFEELINNALNHKSAFTPYLSDGRKQLKVALAKLLDLPEQKNPAHWLNQMRASLDQNLIKSLIPELREEGGARNNELAERLDAVRLALTEEEKAEALKVVFLTKDKELRKPKSMLTKAVQENVPTLFHQLETAQQNFYQAYIAHESLTVYTASQHLMILVEAIINTYNERKQLVAALDYQDLIEKTANLLATRQSTAWVLYKLDQGLDHILVDEAQDTSPAQWQIIARLAEEFFAGHGANEQKRTLFAVGDEKQSIYGFQGANPRQFGEMAVNFASNAKAADLTFNDLSLNLSFRSTGAVLAAVDHVFKSQQLRDSLTFKTSDIRHHAKRENETGLVEIWPTIKTEKTEKTEAFAPLEETKTGNAAEELAQKIASAIRYWLDTKRQLESQGRPIEPGDILILVRKRTPFAPLIIRALKAQNIPVAGADRIIITEEIAVMDMMALGRFLMLPEDDLSLACLLKSPIFNLDDDDLFKLAHKRKRSLWQSLRYFAKREEKYRGIADQLSRWLGRADILPPFEFFANLLEGEGLRKKFVARLGAVAGDALDEFLNLSLNYDDQAPPSLEGFLNWLANSKAEIKRDMEKGRNEVRVMTVHGAKGLEAPIVFLPDTCASQSQRDTLLAMAPQNQISDRSGPDQESEIRRQGAVQAGGEAKALIWLLTGKGNLPALQRGKTIKKKEDKKEQARLLYVAMTRARDELYITGFETTRGRTQNCWYNLIEEGLAGKTTSVINGQGERVEQLKSGQESGAPIPEKPLETQEDSLPLPAWLDTPAASEPHRTIPVTPSSILPYETPENDEEKLPEEPALMSPMQMGVESRFLRGRLVHKLLEYLPDIAPEQRTIAAETLASAHGRQLTEAARESIIKETLRILDNPEYQDLFAPGSEAEVSIIARIQPKGSSKPPILLEGQIDRLVVREKEVLIIDYKSNRPSPRDPHNVAEAYQAQLAAYRLALAQIYPNHRLKAALLWTDAPYLMEIPSEMLDNYEKILHRD